jgi:uncharacterized protein YgbK (DUF1537 family)
MVWRETGCGCAGTKMPRAPGGYKGHLAMAVILGCIADDFTGASDLAAILARSGHKVGLRIGVPDRAEPHDDAAAFEVIALKCRTEPVAEALELTGRAADWLIARGAQSAVLEVLLDLRLHG